jgi:Uma2 family endonuclease
VTVCGIFLSKKPNFSQEQNMSAVLKDSRISVEEYLEGELLSDIKHEYIDGYVYAMAGVKLNHERVVGNLASEFRQHLKKMPCDVVSSDFKVYVSEAKFFYPDVMVFCEHESGNSDYTEKPILIVEVLSDSTQRKDRTTKRWAYQNLPSLQEYVLIEQDFVDIEVSRRSVNWQSQHYFLGDEVFFESLDLKVPVAEIYRRVDNEDMREFLQVNKKQTLKNEG